MNIHIRELHDTDDYARVVELEVAVWGDPDDTIRPGTMMALVHEGALLAGAFVQPSSDPPSLSGRGRSEAEGTRSAGDEGFEQMVGFVFGFPTNRPTEQHSHMAGVLPKYQRHNVGLLLKRYQRDWCLSRGYERVVWTFDPLRGLNANFNFNRLGITFEQYIPNCYGVMKGLNAGAASDRAYALWDLRSERVYQRIYAPVPPPDVSGVVQINRVQGEEPLGVELGLEHPRLLLQIPEDWGQIMKTNQSLAHHWREHSREAFGDYLARGYTVTGFVRGPNRYVLEKLK
jgi:chorismate synthase